MGVQEVADFLKKNRNQKWSSRQIADLMGANRLAVSRALHNLVYTRKEVSMELNHALVGRPVPVYWWAGR